ncbi:hypothetical protein SEND513_10 [Mycobacterium phage Send513]|uniref:Uncharacterized protein n=6 Tax=Papyrusvirus TaxID=1982554 RepID=A0A0Y0AD99_9CAUD|nr:hypothetical protein N842_gp010 [Mycobacterium phage Papyrus]YP_009614235.1 hypothetical protein FDI62_gp10 [Mycobacterium phage Send513]AMB17224.1 hypothetical protein SEA_WEISS13_10 [Mycobacterium phage Weiss13]ARW57096.1 hypothetical protein SEA_ZENON_11 [Mycobacterium phage Zenon]AVO21409.1 hypothetical protein PBI_NILO_11 [Mycobacterium phage Nilo]QCG78117.1 hypothetical protein SEA_CANDLE_10 [Mycobacterium phage Candle]AEK07456.1 hypothetical protein SEND513_10 [Mycobacterium phage S
MATAKQKAAARKNLEKARAARAKKAQGKAIAAAKAEGRSKRASAAATRRANASVSDKDFKAIMRGEKKSSASSKSHPMRAHDAPGKGNKPVKASKKAAKAAMIKADQERRAKRRAEKGSAPVAKSAVMGITRGVYAGKSRASVDKIYSAAGYKVKK